MKTILLAVVGIVLLAAVGVGAYLYGVNVGLTEAQSIRTEFFQSRAGLAGGQSDAALPQSGQAGQRGTGTARNATNGTVKGVQGNSIEVTLRDGSTVTVNVDSQTVIQRLATETLSGIKNGENITVTSDQTGSTVTARTIQLR